MKNILIALSGLSPQVISETVFALYRFHKTPIDEIVILTTVEGKDKINKNCIIDRKTGSKKYHNLKNELNLLSVFHKFRIPAVLENKIIVHIADDENIEISDVSTSNQAKAFPELIIRVLRKYSSVENNIIHCSLSGGRKTMSFFMGMALSFFGRSDDKLWHIVASKDLESSGKYFPETRAEIKSLTLSEIPFVNLRPVLTQIINKNDVNVFSFKDLVHHTQKLLKKYNSPRLSLNLRTHYIIFGENEPVKLSETEVIIYRFIHEKKKLGKYTFIDELSFKLWGDTLKLTLYQKRLLTYIKKLNDKIEKAINDIDYYGKYKILGPTELKEGKGMYGILADPEEIFIK